MLNRLEVVIKGPQLSDLADPFLVAAISRTTLPFDHVLSHVGDGLTGRLAGYRLKNTLVLCTDPSGETRIAVA